MQEYQNNEVGKNQITKSINLQNVCDSFNFYLIK
jgi:hypothetical protein